MKFKEVKEKLIDKGFELECVQTHSALDMLTFIHPNINGQIDVTFKSNNKIPKNIGDGDEFSYLDEWVEKMNVGSVTFNIDISISFMTYGTLDTCGDERENLIYIHGKDLKLFSYVLDLVTNPYSMFDYVKKYNKEQEKFFKQIKRFLPIIEKYKLPHRFIKRNGGGMCLYPSFAIEFYINDFDYLSFEFSTLSFKKEIIVGLKLGGFEDENDGRLSIDCDLVEFENELDNQMKEREEMMVLYRERQKNRE